MERDQREFGPWYEFHGLTDRVKFHVGLDFEFDLGDIFLIDEADDLILSDPTKFLAKIEHSKCICFTATPDNNDGFGLER
jgi:hypothetical protein